MSQQKLPPKPTVGRIVHYTSVDEEAPPAGSPVMPYSVQPALVTGLNDDGTLALHVFRRTSQFDLDACHFTEAKAGTYEAAGKWAWPERV